MYVINTNRLKALDSGYYENQTWGALHKAWKGYIIAKNKYEIDKEYHYAEVIQKLQKELGLRVSSFPGILPTPNPREIQKEQDYNPSEEFDREMQKEQDYNPSEEFDREMQKEQDYNPSEEFDREMQKEQIGLG
jgi:hypothetical protein